VVVGGGWWVVGGVEVEEMVVKVKVVQVAVAVVAATAVDLVTRRTLTTHRATCRQRR
jgi:hypothetical protein